MNKSVLAIVIAATLLISMVGMASAIDPTMWYFTEDTSGVPSGANYIAYKDTGEGIDPVTINNGESFIWASDFSCAGESFAAGNWLGWFDFTQEPPYILCTGETLKIEIGYLDNGGTFNKKGETELAGGGTTPYCLEGVSLLDIPTSAFTIPTDGYLAFRLGMTGGEVKIQTTGGSGVDSDTHIQYPYPELCTVGLFGIGLVTLMGYVGYRRRTTK
jgi:hypothetical protein